MCKINIFYVLLNVITLSEYYQTQAFRIFTENGLETILAHENEKVDIKCSSDVAMAYCGFVHPSGRRYSFAGRDIHVGKCGITINATKADAGTWRCHIGTQQAGVETMKIIHLRIVGEVAAVETNITATHGRSQTLYCTTTKQFVSLSYCRFEPPNGAPFSIAASVTKEKPLLNRYYFPMNKSLDRGDCAVTIRKVKYDDVGEWTCGVGFDDGKEHIDVINLTIEGMYTMSTASATGIIFGVIAAIAFLSVLGFVAWKKRNMLGSRRQETTREAHELAAMSGSPESTPQPGRSGPSVIIESPSEQSEPATTSPLVQT